MEDSLTKQKKMQIQEKKPEPVPEPSQQPAPVEQPASIEEPKPKKPMSEAKKAQFEKARQKRMENVQKKKEEKEYNAMMKILELQKQRESTKEEVIDPEESDSDSSVEYIVRSKPKQKPKKQKKQKIIYISESETESESKMKSHSLHNLQKLNLEKWCHKRINNLLNHLLQQNKNQFLLIHLNILYK